MCKLLSLSILTIVSTSFINCANILGVFSAPGYSQFHLGEVLMTELAHRGHNVTVISVYKPKQQLENYRTIQLNSFRDGPQPNLFERENEWFWNRIRKVHKLGHISTEYTLSDPKVQELIHSNESFDLVILEQFLNEALMGFGPHFNAPIILFSSIGISEWNSHLMGDIRLPSIVPLTKSAYTDKMNIFQRMHNSFLNLCDIGYKHYFSYSVHQEYLRKYFPKEMDLRDIIYNASLMLLNSHVSTTQPTSLTTATIEIGGFHVTSKKLPENIQMFLDEAEHGAILFSMGSNLNMSRLPESTLKNIMRVFSKMEQKVLWKLEGNYFKEIPSNVLISEWLPQSDILEHPNLVVFITHGGLLSITEAVFYGVPMVGIPIFGDQKMNVARCVQKGIAVHLPFSKLNGENLLEALKEVLENSEYKENSLRNANIMRDRVVTPLNLAMYWIEYVIRFNGATHLRNSSLDLYWFQLYFIDIMLLAFAVFLLLRKQAVTRQYRSQRYQSGNLNVNLKGKKIKRY